MCIARRWRQWRIMIISQKTTQIQDLKLSQVHVSHGESAAGVFRRVEGVNLKQNSCQSEVCGPGFSKVQKKNKKRFVTLCFEWFCKLISYLIYFRSFILLQHLYLLITVIAMPNDKCRSSTVRFVCNIGNSKCPKKWNQIVLSQFWHPRQGHPHQLDFICHRATARFSANDPKTRTAAPERVKGTLQRRQTWQSAHDTVVRQSTLPSQRGRHATSAPAYLHFHCHVPYSSASLRRDSATLVDGWTHLYFLPTDGQLSDPSSGFDF